jgi:recombination protein RecR
MVLHTPSLDRLVNELSKLPGIGPKTAQRLAYHILKSPTSFNESLRYSLEQVQNKIHECTRCFSFTENDGLCAICNDPNRLKTTICIVEDPADVARIEASGSFRGQYHILHGAISPLEGIGPKEIRLYELFDRVPTENIDELIVALDADLEGDTTALYIGQQVSEKGLKAKVCRLALGIPIGGDIDYIDHRTLGRAIENRVEI